MSAVLSFTPPQEDCSHVEAAIRLLQKAREEGERRAQALAYMFGLAQSIHGSASLRSLETDLTEVIDSLQKMIVESFVRIARERYAPAGGSLNIDRKKYEEKHLATWGQEAKREAFDPKSLWAQIWNDWGRGQGETEGYRQAAKAIARFFWIKKDSPASVVRGNVVLNRTIWLDDFDKKWSNRNRMSTSSRSDFDPMCKHFETFCAWCELPCFARGYREMLNAWGYTTEVVSRAKYPLGAHAFAVTMNKKVEFHLAPAFATQLNLFLQTFADLEER